MSKHYLSALETVLEDLHDVAPDMPEATVFAFYNDGTEGSHTNGIAFAPDVEVLLAALTTAVANTLLDSDSDDENNRKAVIIQLMTLLDEPLTDEFVKQIRDTMYSVAAHGESEQIQ